jgi:type IV secretory pathway VirB10-like protein
MSFDLSTTNILLAAVVAALFITFVFVLMKLNPTTETKQNQEPRTNTDKEKPQLLQQSQPLRTLPSAPKPAESNISNTKPATPITQAPKAPIIENPAKQNILTPTHVENRENPKQNKATPPPVRAELAPTRKDCIHFYSYLHSLPKNTPIPDECFGCTKIVDCLISPNSTSSNSSHSSKKRGG